MSEETWLQFPLDDRFLVSDAGRIQGKRAMLKLQHDKDGYQFFIAWSGTRKVKVYKVHKVHRAVIQTFVGAIPDGKHINHINGVKNDNRLTNLEICSPTENVRHSFDQLGRKGVNTNPVKGEAHHNSKFTPEQVLEVRRLYADGALQKQLAEQFGTSQAHISRITRRQTWAHI